MCLAVPVKIVEMKGCEAIVELDGVKRKANISFIENASVGDHVIIHAGFAIQKWSEVDLAEYNQIMNEIEKADNRIKGT